MIALILVIIGALNWGLVGAGYFFGQNWNVVDIILGSIEWLENTVYILVGLSGLVLLFTKKGHRECGTCDSKPAENHQMDGGSNENSSQ